MKYIFLRPADLSGKRNINVIQANSYPEAKSIPVIARTANAFNENIVTELVSGMNDHFGKTIFYNHRFEVISKLTRKDTRQK